MNSVFLKAICSEIFLTSRIVVKRYLGASVLVSWDADVLGVSTEVAGGVATDVLLH